MSFCRELVGLQHIEKLARFVYADFSQIGKNPENFDRKIFKGSNFERFWKFLGMVLIKVVEHQKSFKTTYHSPLYVQSPRKLRRSSKKCYLGSNP
jgi:hypothetical protein